MDASLIIADANKQRSIPDHSGVRSWMLSSLPEVRHHHGCRGIARDQPGRSRRGDRPRVEFFPGKKINSERTNSSRGGLLRVVRSSVRLR